MEVHVDGLDRLVADLDRATSLVYPETAKVLGRGALNIKKNWQRRWQGMRHARRLPYAIGYDVFPWPGHILAEIGPDKTRKQGALGNLIEYGSIHNAPRPGGLPALEAEALRFERALNDLAEKLVSGD